MTTPAGDQGTGGIETSPENATQSTEGTGTVGETTGEASPSAQGGTEGQGEHDTFSRSYVENLRNEAARHRTRAKNYDTAMERLTTATVRDATQGILADPSDLAYDHESMADDDGFPDPDKIKEAAQNLVTRKPHYGYRKPSGDIGQGSRKASEEVSLAEILRSRA